jgi:hypothetical protein
VDFTRVDPIARAVLYEGYLLYPYSKSSLKNRRPSPFGALVPQVYSLANGETEPWSMQTEFLLRGDERATLQGRVRFLQWDGAGREATEHEIVLPEIGVRELCNRQRSRHTPCAVTAHGVCLLLCAEPARDSVFKLCLRIENVMPIEAADSIAAYTMLSTHAVMGVCGGRFLSLIDPPSDVRDVAETCRNRGAWPVLVGDRDRHDMILAAPIILYDFPQIAPESPGNLFDAAEIDELLSLRILTLTEAEKHAMKGDARTRALLERTQALADDQLRALHGAMREVPINDQRFRPGDRVRLQPLAARSVSTTQRDIFDLALEGMTATIASVEQDFEGQVYYTVALDDDPGRDLGMEGKPGHRFFFRRDELEHHSGDAG